MSVSSIGLELLNLNIDENKLFILPNIKVNKGGQIIEIDDAGSSDNVSVQTASLLQDTENVLNGVAKVLGNLDPQVSEIATQINTLEEQVDALVGAGINLVANIQTLIDNITIASAGSVPIIAEYNYLDTVDAMKVLNFDAGIAYLKRRQKLSFTNVTLSAGIYVVNHNLVLSSTIVNGISTQYNDSTRFLLTYAFVDVTNGDNICSALNCCSGHDAVDIIHASAMCFELAAETEVNIGFMFDVDDVDTPTWNDITYTFSDAQPVMYPNLINSQNSVNDWIIQLIRIA
jgi:hypothetical protein